MQFLVLINGCTIHGARAMPGEPAATGRRGEARAKAEGPRPFPQTVPVRCPAHKSSVVDGPFPETKQ